VIDIGGACLLFRTWTPHGAIFKRRVTPDVLTNAINARKLQCPVQLSSLTMAHVDKTETQVTGLSRLETSGVMEGHGDVPVLAPSDTRHCVAAPAPAEGDLVYVFPACGHVHGYHPALASKYRTAI
jgi:hypothetical protein